MKKLFILSSVLLVTITACNKSNNNGTAPVDFATLEGDVIDDFTNNVVFFRYQSLVSVATDMQTSVNNLVTTTNEANQTDAKNKWKALRADWEQSEGFLMGPVESNDYDPNTDTWPTDYVQMDSLLASSNPLTVNEVKNLTQSLRGYHPLEYMIWGKGGSKTAAEITARQKTYMTSLIADILENNVQPLYNDWFSGTDNYKQQVITAGSGSTEFSTRQALFLNIVSAMSDICGEVGSGKMFEPFIAKDSTITESPYSSNTLIDFKNNITGLQQVYMGMNGGKGIHDLVAAKQLDLDKKIQAQINASLNSFDQITLRYEEAIFNQRTQVQNTMDQLTALSELLDNELKDYIKTNVKD